MGIWPKHPLIYEINTWVWLDELSRSQRCALTLATVPDDEWDRIAAFGFDAVWLMGVWERSPEGSRVAMANDGLLADFRRALPEFTEADNVGSPYYVRRYAVDAHREDPRPWLRPEINLLSGACASSLISYPTMWRPIIHGCTNTPSTLFGGMRRI